MINFYRLFSKIYPRNIRNSYTQLLTYSGINIQPDRFIGFVLFFGFLFALAVAFDLAAIFAFSPLYSFIIAFISIETAVYMWLILHSDAKARFIEKVLPDALQLMSSNIRAGLTIDKALLLSARPEFGPLQDEINIIGKEITIGKDLGDSLGAMTLRVRSNNLKKTIALIVSGLRSGGQLAPLLEQTSYNLRQQSLVEQKIRSNVMMYVIFIFAAIGFGAPLLFGLSSFLVEVLSKIITGIEIPATTVNLPVSFTKVSIGVDFVITYSLVSLTATSIMGSLILGLINKGKEKYGFKYIPILITLSITIFFLVRFMVSGLLGGVFGFS